MISLAALLKSGLDDIEPREDATDGKLHCSDIANGCTRAVWWAKKYGKIKTFDATTQAKFHFGFSAEELWVKYGEPALLLQGWHRLEPTAEGIEHDGVIGHEDFCYERGAERLLIEVKSTVHFDKGRYVPYLPSQHYLEVNNTNYFIQAAGYATALRCQTAKILLVHRGSGVFQEYDVNIPRFYEVYLERKALMDKAMSSAAEPEAYLPEWTVQKRSDGTEKSYLCTGCAVITCPKHPSQLAKERQLI